MFLVSPNEVPIPKIKSKKRKSIIAVDEVTSIGKKVSVRRSGDVIIHSDEGTDTEEEIDLDEDSEIDEDYEKPIKKVKFVYLMT